MSLISPDYLDRAMPLAVDDRKEIRGQAWKLWSENRWNLLIYVVALIAANYAFSLAFDAVHARAAAMTVWHWIIAGAVFLIVIYSVILLLQRWRFAPLMWRVAQNQGFDVCLKCGRWRREDEPAGEICPKCGAPRKT